MYSCKVSILTTVYNREKYLAACIESVLASTYQDWELIIVDDQSTDDSVAIARQYANKDQRIKVYVNEQNLGDYPNRNKAASYAKGKYLKYLDADDLIYPHGLKIMVETMEAHPSCALGISQKVAEDTKPFPFVMYPKETLHREFLKRGVLNLGPTGTIIKREAFDAVGRFSGTRYIGDIELWYKLAMIYPVVKMVPDLAYWRQHDGQQIEQEKKNDSILALRHNHRMNTLKNLEVILTHEELERARYLQKRSYVRLIIHAFRKGNFKRASVLAKKGEISIPELFKYFY